MDAVSSPCTKLCIVDPASGLCLGCARTLAEIGDWSRMTEPQRRAVMADLPGRRVSGRASQPLASGLADSAE